ncbi:MAG: hypothetical protein M3361_17655 [Candidatus Tectomicrobia bacterium]|nr:hypothetical protein [Candidatus Tectomicrobia bacterium]
MTHEDREREVQRLMAILQGDAESASISEDGELIRGETLPDDHELACCHICDTEITDAGEVQLCEACRREYTPNYGICEQCWGKRRLYVERAWYTCGICDGRGRVLTGYMKCPPHQL